MYLAKHTLRSEWLWPKRQGREVKGLLRSCYGTRGLGQSGEKYWVSAELGGEGRYRREKAPVASTLLAGHAWNSQ